MRGFAEWVFDRTSVSRTVMHLCMLAAAVAPIIGIAVLIIARP